MTRQPAGIVTGTGGNLGALVQAALQRRGWRVLALTRQPPPGSDAVAFQLGADLSPSMLAGAKAVVHCAYDFSLTSWADIHRVNVIGSERVLRAARDAKVDHVVYVSSVSAFDECRSLYGRAKLETERIARSLGAIVIRPGLIWGEPPGATFGRLVARVERARVLPLFGGGRQIQYLVHEQDLTHFICECAEGHTSPGSAPVTIAHERAWTFRQLLEEIARSKNRTVSFLPVPWRLGFGVLKLAELGGLRLDFHSDNLVSLMYQNPHPSFAAQRELGIDCRPFRLSGG